MRENLRSNGAGSGRKSRRFHSLRCAAVQSVHGHGGKIHMSDGAAFCSTNPATGDVVWKGTASTEAHIDAAVAAPRGALEGWGDAALNTRIAYLEAFAEQLKQHKQDLAEAICRETGKPRWEALAEVDAMIGKVPISI